MSFKGDDVPKAFCSVLGTRSGATVISQPQSSHLSSGHNYPTTRQCRRGITPHVSELILMTNNFRPLFNSSEDEFSNSKNYRKRTTALGGEVSVANCPGRSWLTHCLEHGRRAADLSLSVQHQGHHVGSRWSRRESQRRRGPSFEAALLGLLSRC